ncbi:MAG: hypothetical protein ACRDXX_08865 [Stackebrandtia sp.]
MNESSRADAPAPSSSTTLRLAVWLLYAQSVGVAAVAVWLLWLSVTASQTAVGAGVVEALIAAGLAALVFYAAWSLRQGRPGPRGVAIFVELLFLPLGYYLAKAGLWHFAVPAWLIGVTTAGLLVAPSTRQALNIE